MLSEEFRRMQKLAGILNENNTMDNPEVTGITDLMQNDQELRDLIDYYGLGENSYQVSSKVAKKFSEELEKIGYQLETTPTQKDKVFGHGKTPTASDGGKILDYTIEKNPNHPRWRKNPRLYN
jgi:hypothetical protein